MSNIHLVIGNKNYSSWSLRPWMALSMAGIPFRETVIPLDTPDTAKLIAEHSAAGRVPVLYHGRQIVWESLAIMEYLAELFPEKNLWPKTISARAASSCSASSRLPMPCIPRLSPASRPSRFRWRMIREPT